MVTGADSIQGVQTALNAILSAADNEITWQELKSQKVPFATTTMRMLAKKVTAMHFMSADPRIVDQADSEGEDEPVAARADN